MFIRYFRDILLCDDLRTEISGKQIAVGLYSGGVVVPHLPYKLDQLVVRFEILTKGEPLSGFRIKISDSFSQTVATSEIPVSFQNYNRPGSVFTVFANLNLATSGKYEILVAPIGTEDWNLLRDFYVDSPEKPAALQLKVMELWAQFMTEHKGEIEKLQRASLDD